MGARLGLNVGKWLKPRWPSASLLPLCFRGNSCGLATCPAEPQVKGTGEWWLECFDKEKVCAPVNKPGQEVLRSSKYPHPLLLRLEGLTDHTPLPRRVQGEPCMSNRTWGKYKRTLLRACDPSQDLGGTLDIRLVEVGIVVGTLLWAGVPKEMCTCIPCLLPP